MKHVVRTFLVLAAIALGGSAVAQSGDDDPPPFEEDVQHIDPPACPKELEQQVPNCAFSSTFTKDGKRSFCYCAGNGVSFVTDLPIPSNKRLLERVSEVSVVKIKEANSNTQVCEVISFNGKKKKVCWNE